MNLPRKSILKKQREFRSEIFFVNDLPFNLVPPAMDPINDFIRLHL